MDDIIAYYIDLFHLDKHVQPPCGIVQKLNALDRAERGELKARLFTEAKRLGVGGDGLQAIRWLESTFEQIEKYSFRLHEVLFSPGQDIPENLAFYLSQAKKSIDLCVFTISDEVLSGCLKAMHEKGVKIRVITDNNKMRDVGSQVRELVRCGISVKIDNSRYHMHNKFGVIDGRIAFTGSYNWTYTAKQHNQENLLLTTNFTIVHKFMDEFAQLWEQMFWLRGSAQVRRANRRNRDEANTQGMEQAQRTDAQGARSPRNERQTFVSRNNRNAPNPERKPANRAERRLEQFGERPQGERAYNDRSQSDHRHNHRPKQRNKVNFKPQNFPSDEDADGGWLPPKRRKEL